MELSPDLARRGISPINDSLLEASRSVLVSHQPAPSAAAGGTSGLPSDFAERARSDLRSMSERLERLLRERRETMERRRNVEGRFRLRLRHPHDEEEEEEEEGEGLAPPAGLPSLAPTEEGFHMTLVRNRSDIER